MYITYIYIYVYHISDIICDMHLLHIICVNTYIYICTKHHPKDGKE